MPLHRNIKWRGLAASMLLAVLPGTAAAQNDTVDYSRVFGNNWVKADQFVIENERWLRAGLGRHGFRFEEAVAVIFPELIRYSALQDRIEVSLLKTLYTNLGAGYADFSVGPFQMKPSFAEKIRAELPKLSDRHASRLLKERPESYTDREYRAMIVKELENKETAAKYLTAFLYICTERFDIPRGEERIRFLAAAYNYDFLAPQADIEKIAGSKHFAIGIMSPEKWPYAEVSVYWYNHNPYVAKGQ